MALDGYLVPYARLQYHTRLPKDAVVTAFTLAIAPTDEVRHCWSGRDDIQLTGQVDRSAFRGRLSAGHSSLRGLACDIFAFRRQPRKTAALVVTGIVQATDRGTELTLRLMPHPLFAAFCLFLFGGMLYSMLHGGYDPVQQTFDWMEVAILTPAMLFIYISLLVAFNAEAAKITGYVSRVLADAEAEENLQAR